jgi:hypothetical protein
MHTMVHDETLSYFLHSLTSANAAAAIKATTLQFAGSRQCLTLSCNNLINYYKQMQPSLTQQLVVSNSQASLCWTVACMC